MIRYAGGIPDETSVEDSVNVPGMGMTALVGGVPVYTGSLQLMHDYGVEGAPLSETDTGMGTAVHVAISGRYAGKLTLSDSIKNDSVSAVSSLRAMGIRTEMFTGDARDSACAVASSLGLDGFR